MPPFGTTVDESASVSSSLRLLMPRLSKSRGGPRLAASCQVCQTMSQLGGFRIERFPHHIAYPEWDGVIRLLAFAHDRRQPGYWYSRV